jgi:hypothetical protein
MKIITGNIVPALFFTLLGGVILAQESPMPETQPEILQTNCSGGTPTFIPAFLSMPVQQVVS